MLTFEEMEKLRIELSNLRQRRDELILELGEYARENNDLRENSAYLHTEQKIQLIDAQIARILAEFTKLNIEKIKVAYALKKPRKPSKFDF